MPKICASGSDGLSDPAANTLSCAAEVAAAPPHRNAASTPGDEGTSSNQSTDKAFTQRTAATVLSFYSDACAVLGACEWSVHGLVPITLEIEHDGQHILQHLTWDLNPSSRCHTKTAVQARAHQLSLRVCTHLRSAGLMCVILPAHSLQS